MPPSNSLKPSEYTVAQLAREFGHSRPTMAKKLAGLAPCRSEVVGRGKQSDFYLLKDVFNHMMQEGGKLDSNQEQAKLNKARRAKVEIEVKELSGELCRTADVQELWFNIISNAKTRLRGLSHKLTHRIMAASDLAEGQEILEGGVNEALDELSATGIPERRKLTAPSGDEGVEATAKADSKPVGRRKAKAKS